MIPVAVKKLILRALENHRGDNLARAERAFGGMSDAMLAKQHGSSGVTRAALLKSYRRHSADVDEAVKWVEEQR